MFKDQLERLQTQQTNQVLLLKEISKFANEDAHPEITESLKGNNIIFSVLAKVLEDNFDEWSDDFPDWIEDLALVVFTYQRIGIIFPYDQSKEVISAYWQYLQHEQWDSLHSFSILAGGENVKQILLHENEIYNSIKKAASYRGAFKCLLSCAAGFDPWKQKILEDREFVTSLPTLQASLQWNLLGSIALHPDAKMLMPNEVVVLAGKSKVISATNLYALLCNDNDLASIALEPNYIEELSNALDDLLTSGIGWLDGTPRLLLSLLRPIENISTADSYKDVFGEKMLGNLLTVVCDKLLDARDIMTNLPQSRAIAAKTLWNLAYLKENCVRIREANGIERLTTTKATTDNQELKGNIEGILYMCSAALQEANNTTTVKVDNNNGVDEVLQATSEAPASAHIGAARKGHVMISYNWDNQTVVKQIAQSLKDHGYNVWLDIEQMGGSTLEAMALAIEQSEMVLICMSQKYKDSPNCRLEGEYCVNKRVPFVPLMMQKGYAPDGWLGITLGAKLWYDFTNNNNWDSKMQGLTKAIGDNGKILKPNSAVESSVTVPKSTSTNPKVWTAEDMLNWIRGEDMKHPEELFELFCKHDVDQKALGELKYLLADPHTSAFKKFKHFQSICKEMGIGKIGTALQLASAIRKL